MKEGRKLKINRFRVSLIDLTRFKGGGAKKAVLGLEKIVRYSESIVFYGKVKIEPNIYEDCEGIQSK